MTRRFRKIPPLNKKWKTWGVNEYAYYGVLGSKKHDKQFRAKDLASHARNVKPDTTDIEIRYKEGERDLNDIRELGLNQQGLGEGSNYVSGDNSDNVVRGGSHHDYLIGLGGIDRLEAGAGNDFLAGQGDGDLLIGEAGEDYFRLSLALKPESPDQLLDFTPAEGDRLIIDAPTIDTQAIASLKVIHASDNLSIAAQSDALMLYNKSTGELFFNQNGAEQGFGKGGLLAVLPNKPDLNTGDIFMV